MSKSEGPPGRRHIHLDPVGGVAGDMFISAVVDAFPDLQDGLIASILAAGLPAHINYRLQRHRDHALTGLTFTVGEERTGAASAHHHRTFRDIRRELQGSRLPEDVRNRAIAMFTLLAEAEAKVHGTGVDEVGFHELGEWDSIADIVGAAFLISQLNANWSVGPLPLGRGRVGTAHGPLPVPAPATALLLEGFDCFDDGVGGERVTPTGAAILRHLGANRERNMDAARLTTCGTGFGTRQLPGLSNVLRLLAFESSCSPAHRERIAEILFEVDDQTPEDLAIGLERLRAHPAVRDVLQLPAFGKKGRMTTHIRVLALPEHAGEVCSACLQETTTIGVRYQILDRFVLPRRELTMEVDGRGIGIKAASRGGGISVKAEADDIAGVPGGHEARARVRRRAEEAFGSEENS